MPSNSGRDILAAIAGILAGIFGGLALASIISYLNRPRYKCPVCGYPLNFGEPACPNCHTALKWEQCRE